RDTEQLRGLAEHLGAETFSLRTGLPLWTQWSLTKHRWLLDHIPAVATATGRYNIAEWVARDLGAERATELSLASRTGWLDLESGRPWGASMDWSGAPEGFLDNLVTAGTAIGTAQTSGDLAALDGATLTVAGHDHQAAVVGVGISNPGDEFDSCGTAEAFVRTIKPGLAADAIAELTTSGVTVGWHAIKDRWCLLGATQGGLALGRVQTALGVDREDLAALDAAALAAADDPKAVQISDAGDISIDDGADPAQVWRAAAAAVTRQGFELSESLSRISGPRQALVVAGGWTNSAAVMTAKADRFGDLRRVTTTEPGARGAALLAGLAHGTFASYDQMPTHDSAHTKDASP
ncbi:MAG: FGGY family carbohydrate kinase, partial [Ornithinimicrobium sp.]